MPSQNFRVKNGLEVGTGVTISAGIITATSFSGAVNATTVTATTVTATSYGNVNSTTLNVSGVSTFGSSVYLGDGDVAYFGDGNDLLIFHNSTDSIIRDNGTGDLFIEGGNRIKITSPTGIETYAVFNQDGAAELWYDNSKKLETTGYGATVFGILQSQGLQVSGVSTLGNTVVGGATTQLIVNGDARITGILTIGTSSITFDGNTDTVRIGTGVTITSGIVSATEFRGNGANLSSLNASNLGSGTIPDARFPATLPAISGANLTNLPSQAPFSAGTLMLFQQTAAPTGWTKQTTHNDKTLRVVSGTASSGGSTAFTSVFASRTPTGSVSVSNAAVTLAESQIPSHGHQFRGFGGGAQVCPDISMSGNTGTIAGTSAAGTTVLVAGGSGSHTHSNTASFSGTAMDFAVQYVDLIIASKD